MVPAPLHASPPHRVTGDHSAPHPFRKGWCLTLQSTPGDALRNADPFEAMPFWNWPRGNTAKTPASRLAAPWGDAAGAAQGLARGAPEAGADPTAQEAHTPTGAQVTRLQMHVWRGLWAAWRRGPLWEQSEGVHPQRGRLGCAECHRVPLLCPCTHGAPPEPWHWLRFGALDHDGEGAIVCRRCQQQQPRGRRGGLWLTACGLGVPTHDSYPGWVRRARPPHDVPPD